MNPYDRIADIRARLEARDELVESYNPLDLEELTGAGLWHLYQDALKWAFANQAGDGPDGELRFLLAELEKREERSSDVVLAAVSEIERLERELGIERAKVADRDRMLREMDEARRVLTARSPHAYPPVAGQ